MPFGMIKGKRTNIMQPKYLMIPDWIVINKIKWRYVNIYQQVGKQVAHKIYM